MHAADLKPLHDGNKMVKYADDTYLLIPAVNFDKTQEEIDHIERWACLNNLQLNRKKTVEIVFTRRAAGGKPIVTPPTMISITRVNSLVILGVLINDCLTAKDHVTKIIEACSRTLYALRVLPPLLDGTIT